MLLPRVLQLLAPERGKGAGDAAAGGVGHDDLVDEAFLGGDEGVGKSVVVILGAVGYFVRVAQF